MNLMSRLSVYHYSCPRCGNNECFYRPSGLQGGFDSTGCLILLLGGIIPGLLYANRSTPDTQCGNCGHLFTRPSVPISSTCAVIVWLFLLAFVSLGVGLFAQSAPDVFRHLPFARHVASLARMVGNHPLPFTAAGLFFLTVSFPAGCIVYAVSRHRFLRQFRETFDVEPVEFRPSAPDTEARP